MGEILNIQDICTMIGKSRPTVTKYITKDPSFPKKITFGLGLKGWKREEVQEWISNQGSDSTS